MQLNAQGFVRIKPASPATKRASYLEGLDYIARNDEPCEMDYEVMIGMASVQLLAALFGMEPKNVAFDVVRVRAFIAEREA